MANKNESKRKKTPPPPQEGGVEIEVTEERITAETPIIPPGEVIAFSEDALPPVAETPIIPPGNE